MAKNSKKISAAQRDKTLINAAKKLKKAGILSKQAKLHSGRYISKAVAKKVRDNIDLAYLGYHAVPVSKSTAQAARDRGYTVVAGNKIVGPNTQRFRKNIKSGILTGVKPVKGGYMEEIELPHDIYDMRKLIEYMGEGGLESLKLPNEQFAFKYKGHESFKAFPNVQMMLEWMQHYKGLSDISSSRRAEDLQGEFEAFTIFRMAPGSEHVNLRGAKQRDEDRKRARMEAIARGEYVAKARKGKSRAERLAAMHPFRRQMILNKEAARDAAKLAAIRADPIKDAEYKKRARERAKASRERKKGK